MDKLKVILKQLQKYHFWLLSIVAIISGLVGSIMAGRSLSAVYSQEKQKIDAKFTALGGILNNNPHPNSKWKEGVEKLNVQEQAKVRKAWELVYDEQKPLLTWPPDLKDEFFNFSAAHPPTDDIPQGFRERYVNYIRNEFLKLLKIVDAAPGDSPKQTGGGPAARNNAQPAGAANPAKSDHEYRVTWDAANQGEVRASLDWDKVSRVADVSRAQEDLWVYNAILTIIKNLNDEHPFKTPVREINAIEIGKPAADSFESSLTSDRIIHLQGAGGGAAAAPPPAAPPPATDEPAAAKPVDEGRYVDESGKKMNGGATADAEFKRMPIFLKLKIDQREIPRFLVECANSPLPVEVRQLRINPGKGDTTSKSSPASGPKGSAAADMAAYEVPLELHGVIYIYNKPNMAKLGGAPAGSPAPAGGAAAAPVQPAG